MFEWHRGIASRWIFRNGRYATPHASVPFGFWAKQRSSRVYSRWSNRVSVRRLFTTEENLVPDWQFRRLPNLSCDARLILHQADMPALRRIQTGGLQIQVSQIEHTQTEDQQKPSTRFGNQKAVLQ